MLGVLGVTLGLFIPALGFFQDDWHPVFYAYSYGSASLWDLFTFDGRPYAAWPYVLALPVLGFTPLHWHLQLLILRALTVLVLWLCLLLIWPRNIRQVTWVALLFSLYPLFLLQPLAVIYTQHWAAFLLYAVSLLCMLLAFRFRRWYWLLTGLGLLTELAHLFTNEYFTGLELLRPAFLWLLAGQSIKPTRARLLAVLRHWLPYALGLGAFIYWRSALLPAEGVRNTPDVFVSLLSSPIATSIDVVLTAMKDFIAIMFTPWTEVIVPAIFNLDTPANILIFLIIVLMSVTLFWYFTRLKTPAGVTDELATSGWVRQAIGLGFVGVLVGPLPAWMIGMDIFSRNPLWNDRLGLAAMLGASLLLVGLLELLITNPKYRLVIFVLLIGLSAGLHLRTTNDYRWSWTKQTRFYQQLYWRAPYIQQPTTILSDGEIFPFMGYYPTSFAINTLYPQSVSPPHVGFWYAGLYKYFSTEIPEMIAGEEIKFDQYTAEFRADSRDSLVIYYAPEDSQCLWVLRPEDAGLPGLPQITREAAPLSNLERIQANAAQQRPPSDEIFDPGPAPVWCYYFEKADLARQQGDSTEIIRLWSAAQQAGAEPGSGVELLPFIEAFALQSDWDSAYRLTLQANGLNQGLEPTLCHAWLDLNQRTPDSDQKIHANEKTDALLDCR